MEEEVSRKQLLGYNYDDTSLGGCYLYLWKIFVRATRNLWFPGGWSAIRSFGTKMSLLRKTDRAAFQALKCMIDMGFVPSVFWCEYQSESETNS